MNGAKSCKTGGSLGQVDLAKQSSMLSPARLKLVFEQFWTGDCFDLNVMIGTVSINSDMVVGNTLTNLTRISSDHESGA